MDKVLWKDAIKPPNIGNTPSWRTIVRRVTPIRLIKIGLKYAFTQPEHEAQRTTQASQITYKFHSKATPYDMA